MDEKYDHGLVVRAMKREIVRPVPVWLMRQAGRYLPEYRELRAQAGDFWTLCNTPTLAAQVTLQPVWRFGMDAAIVFSDILTIPSALGQAVRMEEVTGPRLADFPGVDRLIEDPEKVTAALAPVYETLGIVRDDMWPEIALIGFAGAPWTLATYMLGGVGTPEERKARTKQSSELPCLLERLAHVVADHLLAQLNAGADLVQIFDSWAGGLTDAEFAAFVIEPTLMLERHVRAQIPYARIIGFPRGATQAQYKEYASWVVDTVSIDNQTPIDWAAREMLPTGRNLQGNLDPMILVQGGEVLDRAVDEILSATRDIPFIFNLGHGVVPETPVEHVFQLLKRVEDFDRP